MLIIRPASGLQGIVIISKPDETFYRIKHLQNNGGGLIFNYLWLSDITQSYNNIVIISKLDETFYRIKYLQDNGGGLVFNYLWLSDLGSVLQ